MATCRFLNVSLFPCAAMSMRNVDTHHRSKSYACARLLYFVHGFFMLKVAHAFIINRFLHRKLAVYESTVSHYVSKNMFHAHNTYIHDMQYIYDVCASRVYQSARGRCSTSHMHNLSTLYRACFARMLCCCYVCHAATTIRNGAVLVCWIRIQGKASLLCLHAMNVCMHLNVRLMGASCKHSVR